jgi:hypothetical protein
MLGLLLWCLVASAVGAVGAHINKHSTRINTYSTA